MAYVYRPRVTRIVGGKRRKTISPYYRAVYNDMVGRPQNIALKLPSGAGVTDKDVARKMLDDILIRQQREAVGLRDASIDSACLPIRKVLADFLRHLRRNGRTPKHVRRNAHDVLRLCELMGATRLGEVNAAGIDVAIGKLGETGIGPKTVNAYRDCLHAMLDWAVRIARLLPANPAEMVVRLSQGDDVRKVRRAMPPDQARALLAVADEFGRGLVYRAAMLTGLRWSELAALEWRDLDLDGERPSVTLRAGTTKSRRGDTLPLNPELAAALLAERKPDDPPTGLVFRVPRLDTFRRDCVRAGIPGFVWNAEKGRAEQIPDDRGRTLDFHALRTTYVSWLSAAGVAPRTAQMLARHTDIRLTMRSYTDPRLLDGHAAVESLPDLQPDRPTTETAKANGTDGPISEVNCNVDCNGQDVSESKPLRIQGSDEWRRRESNPAATKTENEPTRVTSRQDAPKPIASTPHTSPIRDTKRRQKTPRAATGAATAQLNQKSDAPQAAQLPSGERAESEYGLAAQKLVEALRDLPAAVRNHVLKRAALPPDGV